MIGAKALARKAQRDAKARMAAAWHTARFHRIKRMPHLRQVIGDTERPAQNSDEIVAALRAKFGGAANG